jgi:hypothetical protein
MDKIKNLLQEPMLPAICTIPRDALVKTVDIAVQSAIDGTLRELGLLKDGISQREAHRIFGGGIVQSLLNRGLIHRTVGKGTRSKIIYSRKEIEKAIDLQGINLLTNKFR